MRQVFAIMAAGLLAGAVAVVADEGGPGGDRHGWDRGAVLEKYDTNKNGQLDPDEKAALERDREARREEFIKRFDTDGDGKLSEAEKEAAREQYPDMGRGGHGRHGREMHQRMLEKYDANKNGQLDPEEREVARRDREARRAEIMKRFDTDGDGKLSESEREAMREEMRKERGDRKF
jgi:Ca2+-binding EF-hand superfamily protein